MTSQDVRNLEISIQSIMDATAQMIDIFGKVAAECEERAAELERQLV